jgi:hypothetical protein
MEILDIGVLQALHSCNIIEGMRSCVLYEGKYWFPAYIKIGEAYTEHPEICLWIPPYNSLMNTEMKMFLDKNPKLLHGHQHCTTRRFKIPYSWIKNLPLN